MTDILVPISESQAADLARVCDRSSDPLLKRVGAYLARQTAVGGVIQLNGTHKDQWELAVKLGNTKLGHYMRWHVTLAMNGVEIPKPPKPIDKATMRFAREAVKDMEKHGE